MATATSIQDSSSSSDLTKTLKKMLGPEKAKEVLKWITKTGLRIVVAGKTGTGKSTLLNTFLGVDIFEEGSSFDPVTTHVKEYKLTKNGVDITVWDCPGLQDGSGEEDQYLEELKTKTKGDIHLMLYCIDMRETRSDLHWGSAIDKITNKLGKDIWKNTALILTFANMYQLRIQKYEKTPEEEVEMFTTKVDEWREKFQEKLRSIDGINSTTIDELKVLPAGKDGRIPLCGRQNWLSELWAEMLTKVKAEAQKAVTKLNEDRFRMPEEVTEEDLADVHRQPIVLTPKVKKILGTTALGAGGLAAGAGLGAGIGAGIGALAFGIPTLGIATGVGAGVGAAVGSGIGIIAASLAVLYYNKKRSGYEVVE